MRSILPAAPLDGAEGAPVPGQLPCAVPTEPLRRKVRRAATAIEYAAVLSMIAVAVIAGAQYLGSLMNPTYDSISKATQSSPKSSPSSPKGSSPSAGTGQGSTPPATSGPSSGSSSNSSSSNQGTSGSKKSKGKRGG